MSGEWLRQTERRTSKTLFWVFGPSCGLGTRQGGWGHPQENLTQVADVIPGLFDSMEDPKLQTKGRRDLRNVVVLGVLLEALIHIVKFASC